MIYFGQTTSACPEYPVTGYALVLKDSAGENTTEALTQPMGNDLLILKITLLEDEEYSISIVVTNAIGTSTTSPIQISKFIFIDTVRLPGTQNIFNMLCQSN